MKNWSRQRKFLIRFGAVCLLVALAALAWLGIPTVKEERVSFLAQIIILLAPIPDDV